MIKVSRHIYNECIGDTESVKALAMLIFVKEQKKNSVIKDFNYNKLAKITGLHKNTCKKRVSVLADMELVSYVGRKNMNLRFNRVRGRNNVNISKIDKSSVKAIENGLRALFIVEIENRKKFAEQQCNIAYNTDEHEDIEVYKKAKRFCKLRGITNFKDNGISYRYLSRKLGVGFNKVSEIVKYGEKNGIFRKINNIEIIYDHVADGNALLELYKDSNVFIKHGCLYLCKANSYIPQTL